MTNKVKCGVFFYRVISVIFLLFDIFVFFLFSDKQHRAHHITFLASIQVLLEMRCLGRRVALVAVPTTNATAVTAAATVSGRRAFHSQHRTPILPQVHVEPEKGVIIRPARVGYLLQRNQIVKHTPHPLETEMSFLLEREHQRYARHENSESATHFFASRGQTLDALNRSDPAAVRANFFGLELYQDAMKVVLQRYHPEARVTAADLWDPAGLSPDAPPVRHTLSRQLDDYLYLIVREAASGKWTVPSSARRERETLRMTADRALSTHHKDGIDHYIWSNAPQAVVQNPNTAQKSNAADGTSGSSSSSEPLFVFVATYLSGRPDFGGIEPKVSDHAWVTRREMRQYRREFASEELLEALLDIAADSTMGSS